MKVVGKEDNHPQSQGYVTVLILAAACWGVGTVMTKGVLDYIPPLTLLVVQLAASLIFLWSVVLVRRPHFEINRELGWLALAGWLNPGLAYTFGLLGLALTTASLSALIWAAEPILILALAWPILHERPSRPFLALSLVAVIGAVLIVGSSGTEAGLLSGNLLILTAVLCCAIYTVLSRRLVTHIDPVLLTAVQQTVSLIWAIAIWLIAGSATTNTVTSPISLTTWIWAALSGIVYYGLAFWFYISGLKQTTAGQAGFFLNLIPIFDLTAAFLFLNEQLTVLQWLGAFLILLAVFALSRLTLPDNLFSRIQ
jgi:drug/metabolite transporter (DMT)-like permease